MIEFTERDGTAWQIPDWVDQLAGRSPRSARCSLLACQARILWVTTKNGKAAPLNQDGTSHFATCPGASKFRKPVGENP